MFDLHTNMQCKHPKGGVGVIMHKFNTPSSTLPKIVYVSNVHKI